MQTEINLIETKNTEIYLKQSNISLFSCLLSEGKQTASVIIQVNLSALQSVKKILIICNIILGVNK